MEIEERQAKILYGQAVDTEKIRQRYERLGAMFRDRFKCASEDFFSASGRIEICGNHTDHNRGKVLVAAIGVDTLVAAKKTGDNFMVVTSEGYKDMTVCLDDLSVAASEKGTSLALVKGVLKGFKDRGYKIGGALLAIGSTVFRGAGVSSSASFELAVAEVLNCYYNDGAISPIVKAQIAQFSENVYFGKPCGLLDQAGIALGSLSEIDFKEEANAAYAVIDCDFSGYSIVITNTGGDHSNLTPNYAQIREDMECVAGYFGKKVLRDVPEEDFYAAIPKLFKKFGGRAVLRGGHFFEENRRVDAAAAALKSGKLPAFFDAINASGESSYKLLQNCYAEGSSSQEIPLALYASKRILCGEGGVRVHGGGFAGTILAFVPDHKREEYVAGMRELFGAENVFITDIRKVGSTKVQIKAL